MKKFNSKRMFATAMCAVMMLSTLLLAGCSAQPASSAAAASAPADSKSEAAPAADKGGAITIAMLPKFKGENYFDACKVGAQEAADELGITLLYDGPSQDQATNQKQVDIIEGWIAQGVSAIVVSPNDPTAIAPTLQKAQKKGIKVITFDADAQEDARDLFINQVTAEAAAKGLVEATATSLKAKGYGEKTANIAVVSSAKTDANQQAWLAEVKKLLATEEYSFLKINNEETDVYYPGPDETTTQTQCGTLIGRMGAGADQIQAAIGLTSMATPALGAQYESASSKPDVNGISLTGLATPNAIKSYIKNEANPLDTGVLWNCMDLGYLAIQAAYQISNGDITADSATINAGRVGEKSIANKTVILGDALIFSATDVDQFDY